MRYPSEPSHLSMSMSQHSRWPFVGQELRSRVGNQVGDHSPSQTKMTGPPGPPGPIRPFTVGVWDQFAFCCHLSDGDKSTTLRCCHVCVRPLKLCLRETGGFRLQPPFDIHMSLEFHLYWVSSAVLRSPWERGGGPNVVYCCRGHLSKTRKFTIISLRGCRRAHCLAGETLCSCIGTLGPCGYSTSSR
jgi:hypothetical protein